LRTSAWSRFGDHRGTHLSNLSEKNILGVHVFWHIHGFYDPRVHLDRTQAGAVGSSKRPCARSLRVTPHFQLTGTRWMSLALGVGSAGNRRHERPCFTEAVRKLMSGAWRPRSCTWHCGVRIGCRRRTRVTCFELPADGVHPDGRAEAGWRRSPDRDGRHFPQGGVVRGRPAKRRAS
jgi:hypothetical protein